MTIIESLRRARLNSGRSLRAVAEASGVGAPNLSNIESGRRDPDVRTVERIADALGVRFLATLQTHHLTAAAAADTISRAASEGRHDHAYREFIQLADDLASTDAFTRILLVAEEPDRGIGRWGDAIAALVELRLSEVSAPLPAWAVSTVGNIDDIWVPRRTSHDIPLLVDVELVPQPFRRRGVGIEAGELDSI